MKTQQKFGHKVRRGFTLLEIIIVIALISLIVGVVTPNLGKIFGDNQASLVPAVLRDCETGIEAYRFKNGGYPTTEAGLAAIVAENYMKKIPTDPWGRELKYRFPGEKNRDGYDLWSLGADGVESEDDIGNWKK